MSSAIITLHDIEQYAKFDGNLDHLGWSKDQVAAATSHHWTTIDTLRQRMFMVQTRQASESFRARLEQDLTLVIPDETARTLLRGLAEADVARSQS
jgi:uncharacterized NAD(P)/FAD-binding protein YdhS